METKILNINKAEDVKKAIELLRQGSLIAIPTETVYGLAADAKNPEAVKKIFVVKQRPIRHPLILHIDSVEKLENWVQYVPDTAYAIVKHFWPGPLTLLLKKKEDVSDIITAGLETIAIRVPNNNILRMMMAKLDTGLVAPSANLHTKLSPTTVEHVIDNMNNKIPAILDGGNCEIGIESTILSLIDATPTILRRGPISTNIIESVLGMHVNVLNTTPNKVPGSLLKHYQPNTNSILVSTKDIAKYINKVGEKKLGFMYYSNIQALASNPNAIKLPTTHSSYSKMMYQTLYILDKARYEKIIIEQPPQSEEWRAVLDRLEKACYFH